MSTKPAGTKLSCNKLRLFFVDWSVVGNADRFRCYGHVPRWQWHRTNDRESSCPEHHQQVRLSNFNRSIGSKDRANLRRWIRQLEKYFFRGNCTEFYSSDFFFVYLFLRSRSLHYFGLVTRRKRQNGRRITRSMVLRRTACWLCIRMDNSAAVRHSAASGVRSASAVAFSRWGRAAVLNKREMSWKTKTMYFRMGHL